MREGEIPGATLPAAGEDPGAAAKPRLVIRDGSGEEKSAAGACIAVPYFEFLTIPGPRVGPNIEADRRPECF